MKQRAEQLKAVCTGFENQGICAMCGGSLSGRRRVYCSEECAVLYLSLFFWPQASNEAILRANWKCQRCGISADGLACWDRRRRWAFRALYRLEVHHIDPMNGEDRRWHPLNIPGNLRVLCHDCHVFEQSRRPKQANLL